MGKSKMTKYNYTLQVLVLQPQQIQPGLSLIHFSDLWVLKFFRKNKVFL